MRKKLSLAVVVLTAAALFSAGIAPAQATGAPTLPSNQHLFTLDCNGTGYVWSVDETNAVSTRVGTAPGVSCGGGAQVNPLDGKAYAIVYDSGYLGTVDTQTGVVTKVADFTGDALDTSWQLVIKKDGSAFVTSGAYASGPAPAWTLYSVDLASAATTLIGPEGVELHAVGYNPADDTVYGWTRSGVAYTVNTSTGAATAAPAHDVVFSGSPSCDSAPVEVKIDGVVFDSNGNAWFQNDSCDSTLVVQDFASGITYYQGQFVDSSHTIYSTPPYDFYTETVFITTDPVTPTLPNTGESPALLTAGVVSTVILLMLGGIALVVVRRRHAIR